MAPFYQLPHELLIMICMILADDEVSNNSLRSLSALARICRLLLAIAEPLLYQYGIRDFNQLPFLWAAKSGNTATMLKSLAAGAKPNTIFSSQILRTEWSFIKRFNRASVAWRSQSAEYWSAKPPRRGSANTRDTYELDVLRPTIGTNSALLSQLRQDAANDVELDWASDAGTTDIVSEHDDSSVDSDDDGPDGPLQPIQRDYNALHIAAREGHVDAIELLLENGVDIEQPYQHVCGCQPLEPLLETITWREHGPQPPNFTALHLAICSSRQDAAKLLISRGASFLEPVSQTFPQGLEAFHFAAALGDTEVLSHMLRTKPSFDIDAVNHRGLTALYFAIINRRWNSTVPFLLERGANINCEVKMAAIDSMGASIIITPLGEACRVGRFGDALRLIELGADASIPFIKYVPTPFSMNPGDGSYTRLPLLHLCCTNLFVPKQRPTLFYISSRQRRFLPQLVAKLLSVGAPERWAREEEHLEDSLEYVETPLSVALWRYDSVAVKALRDAGADLLARDSLGRNALMLAFGCGPDHFIYVSETGLPIDFRPCHILRIVTTLLNAGVSPNDQDLDGNTVLHYFFGRMAVGCCSWPDDSDEKPPLARILHILLANGANPLLSNRMGTSAFEIALERCSNFAMDAFARHRIDLFSTFNEKEIFNMLTRIYIIGNSAFPIEVRFSPKFPCEVHEHASSLPPLGSSLDYRGGREKVLQLLLELDPSNRFTSNPHFLQRCLELQFKNTRQQFRMLEAANMIWQRGRDMMAIVPGLRLLLLVQLNDMEDDENRINGRIALEMIDGLPDDEVDSLVPGHGVSLLWKFFRHLSPHKPSEGDDGLQPWRERFIKDLIVQRMANIHLAFPLRPLRRGTNRKSTLFSPVLLAIYRGLCPRTWIRWLLHRQPIRGNPQAEQMLYLHRTLTFFMRYPGSPPSSLAIVVRALLDAGADRTALNSDMDTPLSLMLRLLVEYKTKTPYNCNWGAKLALACSLMRPLSVGVDLKRRNAHNMSSVDYAEAYIAIEDNKDEEAFRIAMEKSDAAAQGYGEELEIATQKSKAKVRTAELPSWYDLSGSEESPVPIYAPRRPVSMRVYDELPDLPDVRMKDSVEVVLDKDGEKSIMWLREPEY